MWIVLLLLSGLAVGVATYSLKYRPTDVHRFTVDRRPDVDNVRNTSRDVPGEVEKRLLAKHEQMSHFVEKLQTDVDREMTVADLMTDCSVSVTEDTRVRKLRGLMTTHHTRHLIVVNEGGLVTGVLNDRDLLRRKGRTAADIMTTDPVTVLSDCPLSRVVKMMIGKRVSCVPVVEREQLCGIVTTMDLLLTLEMFLEMLEAKELHVAKYQSSSPGSMDFDVPSTTG